MRFPESDLSSLWSAIPEMTKEKTEIGQSKQISDMIIDRSSHLMIRIVDRFNTNVSCRFTMNRLKSYDPEALHGKGGFRDRVHYDVTERPSSVVDNACSVFTCIIGCQKWGRQKIYKESKIVMGTVVEISVANRSEEQARSAIGEAMGEFQRIDDLMSSYKPGSVVRESIRLDRRRKSPLEKRFFAFSGRRLPSVAPAAAHSIRRSGLCRSFGDLRRGEVSRSRIACKKNANGGISKT